MGKKEIGEWICWQQEIWAARDCEREREDSEYEVLCVNLFCFDIFYLFSKQNIFE